MSREASGNELPAQPEVQDHELDWTQERLEARQQSLNHLVEIGEITRERADYLKTHPSEFEVRLEEAREVMDKGPEATVEWLMQDTDTEE